MKSGYLGLLLSLMSSVAMAQNASSGAPTLPSPTLPGAITVPAGPPDVAIAPAAPSEATIPPPQDAAGAQALPQGGQTRAQAQHSGGGSTLNPAPNDQFEGEIIQTPSGTYMVTGPQGEAQTMPSQGDGDEMQPQPMPSGMSPQPHPPRRVSPTSKAARFRINAPDVTLDMKCPDDEPVKACVDAASMLIDKANSGRH